MADFVRVYTTVPEQLLALLTIQLPYSLPLLRRLQFTKFENGLRETARVILAAESQLEEGVDFPKRLTAAYIDVGGGPDTQTWIYSTLEHRDNTNTKDTAVYEQQLQKIIEESVVVTKAYGHPLVYGEAVLVGTLHDSVRDLLSKTGRIQARETGAYDKWLFKYEDLPKEEIALPEGMHWGTATDDDCRVVISRTNIPRTV